MPQRDIETQRPSLESALAQHRRRFLERFGGDAALRTFVSPGRVNLMGAHLDYNGGPVMPVAIDRGTFLAVRPRGDRLLRLASTSEAGAVECSLDDLPEEPTGTWSDYPLGVVRHVLADAHPSTGLEVLFGGDLPIGAGLSSSASVCVGTAYALSDVWGLGRSMQQAIESALWGEREFVGVRCGIMDPYAVGLTRPGHLLWLDCKDASVDHVPLDPEELSIAVADTGVRRSLAQGRFNERVAECASAFELLRPAVPAATCLRDVPRAAVEEHGASLPAPLLRRARHVVEEVERTFAAREALGRGDVEGFGRRVSEAHASLRDLFEVSIPELDLLVETACAWPGVHGSRLTGAGFGGCVVVALRKGAREGFVEHLRAPFAAAFGREPVVEFFGTSGGPREIPL